MKATIKSKTNVVEFPDIEICRRCGASMQATHHELCEARDGTPTDLDDATVRRLIRQAQQPNQEHIMNEFISKLQLSAIKGECLVKYSERKPKLFFQIDCWGPNAAGDCVIDPHSTGKGLTGGWTWDLMRSSPVRILIADDYSDHELLADMLTAAAKWVRESPELLTEDRPIDRDEQPYDFPF